MTHIDQILEERGTTHGKFSDNADLTMAFIKVAESSPNWWELDNVTRMALINDFQKTARALSGNWKEPEHYRDKAGFSTLVVRHHENRN